MYPKKFFAECNEPIEDGSAFILMPFSSKFEPIYKLIKQTLESPEFNLRCYRSDEIYKPGPIIETILRGIAASQFVIADVTGRNPNVFYELGIAHTVKDFCIILTQNIEDVPFDLRHLHCIIYENSVSGADKLKGDLSKALLAILEEYDKGSKIEMLSAKTYSSILDNSEKSISRANLESIDERKPKLEVDHVAIDCKLLNDFLHKVNSSYEVPHLKTKIHLDISNKESENINIISIDFRTTGREYGFLDWGCEVLDEKKENIIFPNILDPEDVLSCDVVYNLRPYGNNAQFAAKLRKIDKDPHSTLVIAIETLDSSGNSISFEYKHDLDFGPIKKLYESEFKTRKQLDLLRLIQADK